MLFKALAGGFAILLIAVCTIAAVAGENNRLGRQATTLLDYVAERDYKGAYTLLSPEASESTSLEEFSNNMRALRDMLVARHGHDFQDKVRFTTEHETWIPGSSTRGYDAQFPLTVIAVTEEPGLMGEVKRYLDMGQPSGEPYEDLITVGRINSRWKIVDVRQLPDKLDTHESLYKKDGDGFRFRSFKYSSKTTTEEERLRLIEDLERAQARLEADSPEKDKTTIDLPFKLP